MDYQENSNHPTESSGRRFRWKRLIFGCGLVLLGLVIIAPWLIARTGLRNDLFALLVNDESVSVTAADASLGYFSPLTIKDLQIETDDGAAHVQIDSIAADKSWLAMLFQRPQLGTFTFVHPRIDLVVAEGPPEPQPAKPVPAELPVITAEIVGATVVIRSAASPEPAVDLNEVDLTLRLQRDDSGSVFVVDPVKVFDHQPLTPDMSRRGLELVAPLLAGEVEARGAFSFELDSCRIPVGNETEERGDLEVSGLVQLHDASVGLNNPAISRLLKLLTGLLGTRLPDQLKLAEECAVRFHVAEGEIWHEGFALMLPHKDSSVRLQTSGAVRLDRTMDIKVEVQLPQASLGESELARHLTGDALVFRLTGTLDEPQLELAEEADWLTNVQTLLSALKPGENAGAAPIRDRLESFLGDLKPDEEDREPRLLPDVRGRLRDIRKRRRKE